MALSAKSPNWGDSDSILIWKFAVNWYLVAVHVDPSLSPPRLGSPDNENWVKAWKYLNAIA
jgi:hypothetical protein